MSFQERFKGKTSKITKEGINAIISRNTNDQVTTNMTTSRNQVSNVSNYTQKNQKAYSEVIPTSFSRVADVNYKNKKYAGNYDKNSNKLKTKEDDNIQIDIDELKNQISKKRYSLIMNSDIYTSRIPKTNQNNKKNEKSSLSMHLKLPEVGEGSIKLRTNSEIGVDKMIKETNRIRKNRKQQSENPYGEFDFKEEQVLNELQQINSVIGNYNYVKDKQKNMSEVRSPKSLSHAYFNMPLYLVKSPSAQSCQSQFKTESSGQMLDQFDDFKSRSRSNGSSGLFKNMMQSPSRGNDLHSPKIQSPLFLYPEKKVTQCNSITNSAKIILQNNNI